MGPVTSIYQHTLNQSITFMGLGLHTGKRVVMTLRPSAENTGIRFLRKGVAKSRCEVLPRWHNTIETQLCTGIGNEQGVRVLTIEHLMAALRCCGIDNLEVALDQEEVPIMDGSAAPFVKRIKQVGVCRQAAYRWAIRLHHPLVHSDGDKWIMALPADKPGISIKIDFPSSFIGTQSRSLAFDDTMADQIAAARTFGFADQIADLRRQGLALGGSLRNALLVDTHELLNAEGLRYPDEFVRHKLLDTIGDLSLAGAPIEAQFHAFKPGHTLIQAFVQKLFAYPHTWSFLPLAHRQTPAETKDHSADDTSGLASPADQQNSGRSH